jgi:hypothetical protein
MARKQKTYAWNFRLVEDGTLVLRAISQDSIGVLKLKFGQFEFWHNGTCHVRTKSIAVLFRGIDKIERST